MKKLILVAAPPACGKTYVSEKISRALGHIVYLDKDDLGDLVRAAFSAGAEDVNMDGEFYRKSIRKWEYSTLMKIACSALRFEDRVLVNAPFGQEVRDSGYMRALRESIAPLGAELFVIWVTVPVEICRERMIRRNSERDTLKLRDFDNYVKHINFAPPKELLSDGVIDRLIIFDARDDASVERSLDETLRALRED